MKIIAGVDEVGRGSLIGPVYAAAVILNNSINRKLLKDSKSLTKSKREKLSKYIKKNSEWSIGKASIKEIEKINILQASLLAMTRAIKKLKKKPALVLIESRLFDLILRTLMLDPLDESVNFSDTKTVPENIAIPSELLNK